MSASACAGIERHAIALVFKQRIRTASTSGARRGHQRSTRRVAVGLVMYLCVRCWLRLDMVEMFQWLGIAFKFDTGDDTKITWAMRSQMWQCWWTATTPALRFEYALRVVAQFGR